MAMHSWSSRCIAGVFRTKTAATVAAICIYLNARLMMMTVLIGLAVKDFFTNKTALVRILAARAVFYCCLCKLAGTFFNPPRITSRIKCSFTQDLVPNRSSWCITGVCQTNAAALVAATSTRTRGISRRPSAGTTDRGAAADGWPFIPRAASASPACSDEGSGGGHERQVTREPPTAASGKGPIGEQ
ncbi:hypothetical protein [Paenibacillus elgii]|uniref:hypothetical protein n=1 Tax=Paenibacillus elgii TaxID=189691 RepID=UPI0013D6F27D|nr:hypothetical protein [Paenibacillus elgii]